MRNVESKAAMSNVLVPPPGDEALTRSEPVRVGSDRARGRAGGTLNPSMLAYLMGPPALVALLVLMHFHVVAHEPAWLWVALFVIIPVSSLATDHLYDADPNRFHLNLRVAVQAASVTAVIYLSGWGPVLSGAYAFLALENVARSGSRVWRTTALWSLTGIVLGQIAIWLHWAPSFLSLAQTNALALMGAFILVFVIRMAGATMEQKERAEASTRLSEDRFRSLIQNSTDATLVIDASGICTYVSPAILPLLGIETQDLVGSRPTDFVHPDDRQRVRDRLSSALQSPENVLIQFRMVRHDGTWRDVEAVVSNQLDRPSVAGYVANIRDITERKEFEALLAHRAVHDPLTGLANRQLVLDRAEQRLARSRRTGTQVAAYFIDLDNFKDANDSLGHEAGDRLLQAVAARFVSLLRADDTVGRLGGDEFVVLAEGASLSSGPERVAERLRQSLRMPFRVDGYEDLPISVTASIGIATGARRSAQELLRDADIALYQAKGAGRDRSVLFEEAMQSAAVGRLELKSDLDAALADGQFFLLYQPIFDLGLGGVHGVEALIRWNHPSRGIVSPDEFVPTLEDTGMIIEVGRWVLLQACTQAGTWRDRGHPVAISVNVSMRQLESSLFVDHVEEALAAGDLEPSLLTLEVTESTLMRDAQATVARLRRLKEVGVMIAIDDFGTGYSSMAYLRQFPVDVLKIDRTFVAGMDGTPDADALVRTLVELGRILGLVTLAEGIEDQTQLDGLRAAHCDRGQGFIVSRPVEPAEVDAFLDMTPAELGLGASPLPLPG
ncbi:MAG TPA: EAL domain-containing protein [Acidimicrobiales bacterium]|nr:EAL domain-containing protein [Acidimicrobiales bacterium]